MMSRRSSKVPGPRVPSWAAPLAAAAVAVLASCPASAQLITSFEDYPPGENGQTLFRQPSFSGTTARFLAPSPNLAAITDERALSGTQSLQLSWQFLPNQTNPWLRLTTFNTANLPNPALDLSLALEFALFVPSSTPDFYVTLGVRETNAPVPIGANGGTNGEIEFVGATGTQGMAPFGQRITAKDQWVTVSFEIPFEPVQPFTGDGQLVVPRGVLEHLAFTPVSAAATGPYTVYIDDLRQRTAIPEPGTLALLAAGLLPLAATVRRRRKRA